MSTDQAVTNRTCAQHIDRRKFLARTLAGTLAAAAFALHSVATAAPSTSPASTTQDVVATSVGQAKTDVPQAKKHHRENDRISMWVPGFGSVNQTTVKSLKLNDSQMKLVADAQAAQDQFEKSLHDLKRTIRQDQKAQLNTGKIDPHTAKSAADDLWKKGMSASRDPLTKKWLAVWDSLDSTQQQKVTAYLKQRADEPAKPERD